jgi:hypothetical protein
VAAVWGEACHYVSICHRSVAEQHQRAHFSNGVEATGDADQIGIDCVVERPMICDGMVVARRMMNLSSSFDHRVVDGIDAARFIQTVRGYLEFPATLFVD